MFDKTKKKTLAQKLAMKVEPEGYLYLIHCVGFTYYKIGRTKNLKNRLQMLQTGCPFDLNVIASVGSYNLISNENYLHNLFKNKKARNEWFDFDNYEIDLIKLWFKHEDNRSVIDVIWRTNKTTEEKFSLARWALGVT